MLSRWLLLASLIAQAADPGMYSGAVPADVPTWRIVYEDGNEYFVGLRLGNEWYAENVFDLSPGQQITVVLDEPWNQDWTFNTMARKISSPMRETEVLRKARLEKGWRQAGYELITSDEGVIKPVPQGATQQAQRARQMSAAVMAKLNPPPDAAIDLPSDRAPAGFFSRWGAQIAIAVVGLLLVAVILKTMVFP